MAESPPLRVCYLIAYFHPFESGAERQALAQGEELVRLGHTVHVVTHRMPGVPADEVVRGIRVHRWVRSSKRGPLFSVTFVAGALAALRRLRAREGFDLIHTHQALWEGVAAGLRGSVECSACRRWSSRRARAITERPRSCYGPAARGCSGA